MLAVPWDPVRHITAKRQARSARFFVGSTPFSTRNTPSEAISRCNRLTKRPASSGMRSQGLEREGMLVEPGEVGLASMEPAGDGIDQDAKGRLAKLPAGLAPG